MREERVGCAELLRSSCNINDKDWIDEGSFLGIYPMVEPCCAERVSSLRPSDRGRMSGMVRAGLRVNVSYVLLIGPYAGLSSPVSLLDIPPSDLLSAHKPEMRLIGYLIPEVDTGGER